MMYTTTPSPLGEVLLGCDDAALLGLWFRGQKDEPTVGEGWVRHDAHPVRGNVVSGEHVHEACAELVEAAGQVDHTGQCAEDQVTDLVRRVRHGFLRRQFSGYRQGDAVVCRTPH